MYSVLLAVGIHHREMIQRKSLNYERILNVEIEKTNNLISKLVPFHILSVIKNEKRQVDEFEDQTLLYTDMVKFNEFSKSYQEPREAVNLLNKIFSRFDQLCEENKVYKVFTVGDSYVIMGYNGRVDKNKRFRGIVVDEANRVINTGLEMIDIVKELKESTKDKILKSLNFRIGIHSGQVIAGIIGSKVVRYDIFGEGVLIANKMMFYGKYNHVCISEDTRKLLLQVPEIANEYYMTEDSSFNVPNIGKTVTSYVIERKQTESFSTTSAADLLGVDLEEEEGESSQSEKKGQSLEELTEEDMDVNTSRSI